MLALNAHYQKLQASYLFSQIAEKVQAFQTANPDRPLIKMGIGDVTEPLPLTCREAMKAAVDEMGTNAGFRGYGPYEGYDFLREAIAKHEYQARGCAIEADEIFVSDGSKQDSAHIQELFAQDVKIAVPDPVYPVYVDTNVMAGRTGDAVDGRYTGLHYLEATAENQYIASVPSEPMDVVYLCFPNNPTGAMATRAQLQAWVDYARASDAVILYDAAYAAFIQDADLPRSIYEIPGARFCAIEFRSFSKNAGFTGTRCAYAVVPKEVTGTVAGGERVALHSMWARRQASKFNGVSYPVQAAAAAVYSEAGQAEVKALVAGYMANAARLKMAMQELGYPTVGGDNAPYIWVQVAGKSWDFFDRLLHEAAVVCTPGAGFGQCGEGHIRLSAFNSAANVEKAVERISALMT